MVVRGEEGQKPGTERRGGQATRDVQRQSDAATTTCDPAATTSTNGSATCQPEASWRGSNFPNWTGFSGQVLNEGPDLELNEIMIKAYNDWHVDEWCAAYPDRFIPAGSCRCSTSSKAALEVRRLAGKGCHAVTFSENPAALRMPSIHSGHWDPLFAACSDEGTVLCLHVGSSSKAASTTPDAPPSVPMSLSSTASIYSLGDLMWADFWWRFPELRFSLTEGTSGGSPTSCNEQSTFRPSFRLDRGTRFPTARGRPTSFASA